MMRNVAATLGVMILVTACGAPAHDAAADLAAIGKVRDGYVAAFNAGNAKDLGALYTADAQSMENAQPTATGPQGVETANSALMSQMTSQSVVVTPEQTDVSGDMAFDRGTYKTTLTPKSGAAVVEEGRYLVVLKRQTDGSWKIAAEMGNLPTAPAPVAATPMKAPAKAPAKKK